MHSSLIRTSSKPPREKASSPKSANKPSGEAVIFHRPVVIPNAKGPMHINVHGVPHAVYTFKRLPTPEVDVTRHNPGQVDTRPTWVYFARNTATGANTFIRVKFSELLPYFEDPDDFPLKISQINGSTEIELSSGGRRIADVSVIIRKMTIQEERDVIGPLSAPSRAESSKAEIIECDYDEFRRIVWKYRGSQFSFTSKGVELPSMLKLLYHHKTRELTSHQLNVDLKRSKSATPWRKLINAQAPQLIDGHMLIHSPKSKRWRMNIA